MTILFSCLLCVPGFAQHSLPYQPLLTLYLQNVRKVEQQRKAESQRSYVTDVTRRHQISDNITAHEAENLKILDKSADSRQHHQLDFDREVPELGMVMLGCPASARIFTTLCREKKVDELLLVAAASSPWLLRTAPVICPEWVVLLHDIDRRHPDNPISHRLIIQTLYAAGVDTLTSRPLLATLALSSNYGALGLLFFTYDRSTGERLPKINRQNLRLLKHFTTKPQSTDPEVMEVCAEYAVAVQQDTLAKAICTRLLLEKYHSLAHPYTNHYADIPADDSLGRARSRVMDLIFYSLPDKHLFRLLYDISRGQTAIAQERLDKDYAESYIVIVYSWDKGGHSPTASPFDA